MHPPLPLPFRTSAAAAAAPAAAAIAAALGPSRRGRPGSRGPGGRAGKGLKGATARFLAIFPAERPRPWLRAEASGSCSRLRGAGAGEPRGPRCGLPQVLGPGGVSAPGPGLPPLLVPPRLGLQSGWASAWASLKHEGATGTRRPAPAGGRLCRSFPAAPGPSKSVTCFLSLRSPAGHRCLCDFLNTLYDLKRRGPGDARDSAGSRRLLHVPLAGRCPSVYI